MRRLANFALGFLVGGGAAAISFVWFMDEMFVFLAIVSGVALVSGVLAAIFGDRFWEWLKEGSWWEDLWPW